MNIKETCDKIAVWWNTPVPNNSLPEGPDNYDMGAVVSAVREANKRREISATLLGFAEKEYITVDELRQRYPDRSDEYVFRRCMGYKLNAEERKLDGIETEGLDAKLEKFFIGLRERFTGEISAQKMTDLKSKTSAQ